MEFPTQPTAALTVKAMPPELFARFRVADAGGVRTSPLPTEALVTAIVAEPERGVNALIVIVAGAPGPVTVLHVTGPDTVPVSR